MGGATKIRCLVTGGSGFLGRHLVEQLVESGRYEVTVFDIRPPKEPVSDVAYVTGDLTNDVDVQNACQGQTVVFHCATAAPTASNAANRALMEAVNVGGTERVIAACRECGVKRLVYTSSASVVFDGRPLRLADESAPYAARPMDFYTGTKAASERLVLGANDEGDALRTIALRPSGIFGEHDTLTVPTIVANARRGKMKYIIGAGRNRMDYTYAGNVAAAHLDADAALAGARAPRVAGKAFFVTNDDPRPFWGFMGDVCQGLGYARPHIHLPFWLVYLIALFVQHVVAPVAALCGRQLQTDFTPFRVTLAAVDRTFDCSAAKSELGYRPRIGVDEGLKRTVAFFHDLRNDAGGGTSKSL